MVGEAGCDSELAPQTAHIPELNHHIARANDPIRIANHEFVPLARNSTHVCGRPNLAYGSLCEIIDLPHPHTARPSSCRDATAAGVERDQGRIPVYDQCTYYTLPYHVIQEHYWSGTCNALCRPANFPRFSAWNAISCRLERM